MARQRIIELITKVKGAPELKKTETALRRIDKQTALANKQLAIMNKNTNKLAKSMGNLVGVAGVLLGARAFGGIIRATVEQEKAVAQLNAVLESTGSIAGKTSAELQDLASSLQSVTTFGDEAVIGASSLLLTFKEIRGVNFDRTLESILDVSVAMKQDLKSSAVQVGKALNDPITGLSALSRVGITFTDTQKDLIKSMAETGDIAGAQVKILEELESQFKGSARAARQTLGGALDALSNSFGDLLEAGEGTEDLTESVNELADTFNDPQFKSDVQGVVDQLLRLAGTGLSTMTNFTEIVGFLADEFKALYGVVEESDLVRLYEKQASLQERINNTGWTSVLTDTEELNRQLQETNRQIAAAESRILAVSQLQPVVPQGQAAPDLEGGTVTAPTYETKELEKSSQLFIDLANNMKYLDEQARLAKEAEKELTEAMNANSEAIEYANGLFAQFNPEVAAYQKQIYEIDEALRVGAISQEEWNNEMAKADEALAKSQSSFSFAEEGIKLFDDSFQTMLDGVLQGTQSISEGFEAMAKTIVAQLVKIALQYAIFQAFGGAGAAQGSFGAALGKSFGFAKGGVLEGGNVVPFADGGIVSKPTMFGMGSGGLGIMGEAGPEMIAPVKRMSNGQMGVGASPVNVTVNNMASGVSVKTRETENGLTLDVVMEQVSAAIQKGGNNVANALENTYSVGRGRAVY